MICESYCIKSACCPCTGAQLLHCPRDTCSGVVSFSRFELFSRVCAVWIYEAILLPGFQDRRVQGTWCEGYSSLPLDLESPRRHTLGISVRKFPELFHSSRNYTRVSA